MRLDADALYIKATLRQRLKPFDGIVIPDARNKADPSIPNRQPPGRIQQAASLPVNYGCTGGRQYIFALDFSCDQKGGSHKFQSAIGNRKYTPYKKCLFGRLWSIDRHSEGEGAARTLDAFSPNATAMHFHRGLGNGKPQSHGPMFAGQM